MFANALENRSMIDVHYCSDKMAADNAYIYFFVVYSLYKFSTEGKSMLIIGFLAKEIEFLT